MTDDKKHVNRFIKGWATDFTPEIQPQDVAIEMYNMQIIMSQGRIFAVHPIKGTKEVAEHTSGFQVIGLVKNVYNITVYSENRNGMSGIGLLEYDDVADTWNYLPIYYHKRLNFSVDNQVQGQIWRDNEKREYNHFWDDRNPPRVINLGDSIYKTYFASGTLVVGQQYMVIQGTVTDNAINYGPGQVDTVFTATLTTYTGVGLVIAYFPYELLDEVVQVQVGTIKFLQWLPGGALSSNAKKYYYQLEDDSGVRSPWMSGTTPFHITRPVISSGSGGVSSYQNYQGLGGATGIDNDPNQNTIKGIRLRISGIDTNFARIRVAVSESTAYNVFNNPKIFFSGSITASTMDIDHMGGVGLEEILMEDILTPNEGILYNRAGKIADSYFFIANYATRRVFNWNAKDSVTIRAVMRNVTSDRADAEHGVGNADHPDTTTTLPLLGHGTNTANLMYQGQWYMVKGINGTDSISYNDGLGAVIYNPGDVFYVTGTIGGFQDSWSVNAGTPTVVPVLRICKYGTTYQYIEIIDDFLDGKGMTVDAHMRGYWRRETYRFGIDLEDLWGNKYPTFWIGDKVMPRQDENASNVHHPIIFSQAATLMATTTDYIHQMKHLGIQVDINFNDLVAAIVEYNPELAGMTYAELPNHFRKFRIVRAPRDKQILYQGLLYSTVKWQNLGFTRIGSMCGDGSKENISYPPGYTYDGFWNWSSPAAERAKNFYELYSPDHLMRFNDDPVALTNSDLMELVQYMDDANRPNYNHAGTDTPSKVLGTYHTVGYHGYSKFTEYVSAVAGMTPVTSFAYIDQRWTQSIASGGFNDPVNSPPIGSNQDRYWNGGMLWNGQNSFISVGSHKLLIYTRADETGGDPDFANGFGYLNEYTHQKPVVNIIRPKANLYGGTTEDALRTTPYITTGHDQLFDGDFIAHLADTVGKNAGEAVNVEVWGGDCFVQFFDVARHVQFMENNFAHDMNDHGHPLTGIPPIPPPALAYTYSHGIIFPVESNINIGLREGRHLAKDKSYGLDMLVNTNGIAFGPLALNKPENFVYNDAYSAEQNGDNNTGISIYRDTSNRYETSFRWSKQKSPNERIDSFRQFPVGQVRTADGGFGPISNLQYRRQKLLIFQELGVHFAGVNERGLIPNSLGQALATGIANVAEFTDNLTRFYGCRHRSAVVEFDEGYLFYDAFNKAICILVVEQTAGVVHISAKLMIDHFLKTSALPGLAKTYPDRPISGIGVTSYYDPKFKMAVIVFKNNTNGEEYSVRYNTEAKHFSGSSSLAPAVAVEFNEKVVMAASTSQNYPLIADGTNYTAWTSSVSNASGDLYLCILSFTSATPAVDPASDTTHWKRIRKGNALWTANELSSLAKFFGLAYEMRMGLIANPESDQGKVFNNFEFIGMLLDFWTHIHVSNDNGLTAQDVNLHLVPLRDYERIDEGWYGSVPLSADGRRMEGNLMKITLKNINTNGQDMTTSLDIYTRLFELITLYNKTY